MKNTIRFILLTVLLCVVYACQEKVTDDEGVKVVEPIFPEPVTDYDVVPGEELEFTFTPNLDWELSVSEGSSQYFKLIEENGRQREKISGKASETPITVRIWVNPLEEYDHNRSCKLILKMGGQSKDVANYMRPAKNRTFALYCAKIQDGAYLTDESGAYVYEEAEAEQINVVWSEADFEFMVPVKIESNCQWDIDRTSFPEWLELKVPDLTSGVVYLAFRGVSLEEASADIHFKSGDKLLKTLSVSIPSCSGLEVYSAIYEEGDWKYSDTGYEYAESPLELYTMVWTGYDCRLPVMVDSKCEWSMEKPEWVMVELDDKRAGQDIFTIMCDPSKYPLDDAEFEIAFKYLGKELQRIKVMVPGCRQMVSYSLGMSLSALEFNYSGQYKTPTGYMDAPVNATVTGPVTAVIRIVEIVDGVCSESVPEWLQCELYVSDHTDTDLVLQTRALDMSVSENMTDTSRSAYIFILPEDVQNVAELFNDGGQTIKDEYLKYAIPVSQACIPADYLTPENTAADMEAEGASLVKSAKSELYECFGTTPYAYEMTYKNTWSSDVARVYLTEPYTNLEIYDAEKNLVENKDDFWFTYTDSQDDKSLGVVKIPTTRKQLDADGKPVLDEKGNEIWTEIVPEAGTGFIVFKGENSKVLCVLEFVYAPEVFVPEEPEDVVEDELVDASQYFQDLDRAQEAGATFHEIKNIYVPSPDNLHTDEERYNYEYRKNLKGIVDEYKGAGTPVFKLTYTKSSTQILNLSSFLEGVAEWFTINPALAGDLIVVDDKVASGGGARLVQQNSPTGYHGSPKIRMYSKKDKFKTEEELNSITEKLNVNPMLLLFHDSGMNVVLAIVCVLEGNY